MSLYVSVCDTMYARVNSCMRECVCDCVYMCVATATDKEAMTLKNSKETTWQRLMKTKNWENEIIVFYLPKS